MNLRKNLFWAIPFIVVGVVWIMRNTGMITDDLFHIIVSWQMLVMYIGIGSISRRHYIGGLITFLVGADWGGWIAIGCRSIGRLLLSLSV